MFPPIKHYRLQECLDYIKLVLLLSKLSDPDILKLVRNQTLHSKQNHIGLLAHMDQMRMDPKHQFAAQYVLSRAANERREREALLAAHLAMTTNMQPSLLSGHMSSAAAAHHMAAAVSTAAASVAANPGGTASPSAHSDSSTRISTPMNTAAEMKVMY